MSWVIKILCCHGTIVTQSKITHWYLFCHKYSGSKAHTVLNRFKLRHVIVLQYFWPWRFLLPLLLLESGEKNYSSTSISLTKCCIVQDNFTAIFLIGGQQNETWTNWTYLYLLQLVQDNLTAIFLIGGEQNGTWTNQTSIVRNNCPILTLVLSLQSNEVIVIFFMIRHVLTWCF